MTIKVNKALCMVKNLAEALGLQNLRAAALISRNLRMPQSVTYPQAPFNTLSLKMTAFTLSRHTHPLAFQQVCDLGKKNKKTLGFFPVGAFEDHADKKNIIVHVDAAGTVDGYVAFRRSGMPQRVSIVHLCVHESRRGQGVARVLVTQLVRQTEETLGIGLFCRPDYKANDVWPRLDFKPVHSKLGRGADGNKLVYWWRDNGHPTLFSQVSDLEYIDTSTVEAVLDANVIFDFDDHTRKYHAESSALLVDWLSPLVRYSVSPEINLEVHRQQDEKVQARSRKRIQSLNSPPANTDRIKQFADRLRRQLAWGDDDNTISDSKHLAYAHLQGFRFFITRDQPILNAAQGIEDFAELTVIRPSDFVMRFDELQREAQYRPSQIGDTKFRLRLLKEPDTGLLYAAFRNHSNGELKKDFQGRLMARLAQPNQHQNNVYETKEGSPLILTSTTATNETMTLEFFRTTTQPIVKLLARFALNRIITDAFSRGKVVVICSDVELSEQASTALSGARFHRVEKAGGYVKFIPRLIGSPEEVASGLRNIHLQQSELRDEAEKLALSIETAAQQPTDYLPQVEELLWPAKILHDEIGNFVMPIKPTWARKLFDEDVPGLFSDPEHERLLLNWENVYYSAAHRPKLLRPGSHILWYVSSEQGHKVSAIRACSTVEEIRVGTPHDLHTAFKRLGVYRLENLTKLAERSGQSDRPLLAIRFSRTELFKNNISHAGFQQHRKAFGLKSNNIQGPLQISSDEFRSLYLKGYGF